MDSIKLSIFISEYFQKWKTFFTDEIETHIHHQVGFVFESRYTAATLDKFSGTLRVLILSFPNVKINIKKHELQHSSPFSPINIELSKLSSNEENIEINLDWGRGGIA